MPSRVIESANEVQYSGDEYKVALKIYSEVLKALRIGERPLDGQLGLIIPVRSLPLEKGSMIRYFEFQNQFEKPEEPPRFGEATIGGTTKRNINITFNLGKAFYFMLNDQIKPFYSIIHVMPKFSPSPKEKRRYSHPESEVPITLDPIAYNPRRVLDLMEQRNNRAVRKGSEQRPRISDKRLTELTARLNGRVIADNRSSPTQSNRNSRADELTALLREKGILR